jgi:hypothetical protein
METSYNNETASKLDLNDADPEQHRLSILGKTPFGGYYYILAIEWFESWKIGKWAAGPIV